MRLIGFLFKLVFLPVKIVLRLFGFSVRTSFKVGKLPLRATSRSAGIIGLKGFFFLAVGVVIGLLVAPETGRDLRRRIAAMIGQAGTSDEDLAEKVTFELAHAPRTWHLEQPEVAVASGRVTLRGIVPAADARDELGRVAAAIPGVASVDNQIVLDLVAEAPSES